MGTGDNFDQKAREARQEIIRTQGIAYLNEHIDQRIRGGVSREESTGDPLRERNTVFFQAYIDQLQQGKYFDTFEVELPPLDGGEKISETASSPYDRFSGMLKKYEYFGNLFTEEGNEKMATEYNRRADMVRKTLRAMEEEVGGFRTFLDQKDGQSN